MNLLAKRVRVGSKIEIQHKQHGKMAAIVAKIEGSTVFVERYLQSEQRWLSNGPAVVDPATVIKIVRK